MINGVEPNKNAFLQIPHPFGGGAAILCKCQTSERNKGGEKEGRMNNSYYFFHACHLCKSLNS